MAAAKLPVTWSRWIVVGALIVVVVLGAGFAADRFTRWADQNFGAFDTTTEEGVEVPTSSMASGGPGSLVDFDDLGYQGRTFAAGAPTLEQLREFAPETDVVEPIRVYVGLDSADTLDERLQLAVDELRRTGAFDREVLVVATPTGTGWINPNAARTLEYMYGGNTAIVGVQYSFLPSWVAMLIDTHSAPELGEALFAAVHAAWAELPPDDRPLLVAFGESLGSFGGEAAFAADDVAASIDSIVSQADAALYVGPTRDNPIFGPVVDGRDAGSPDVAARVEQPRAPARGQPHRGHHRQRRWLAAAAGAVPAPPVRRDRDVGAGQPVARSGVGRRTRRLRHPVGGTMDAARQLRPGVVRPDERLLGGTRLRPRLPQPPRSRVGRDHPARRVDRGRHRAPERLPGALMASKFVTNSIDDMRSSVFFEGPGAADKMSRFWILLSLAAVIAASGVVADSTATVIGAMIVAPLMTPILGTMLAVVLGDRPNLLRSIALVAAGAAAAIAIGFLVSLIVPIDVVAATNSQVAGRVSPRLIDLLAAVATGAVGSIALVRRDIADTLPGVAIAISLVPPLTVVGLTAEAGEWDQAMGALLLFGTNVAAILTTGIVVMGACRVHRMVVPAVADPATGVRAVNRRNAVLVIIGLFVVIGVILSTSTASIVHDRQRESQVRRITTTWAEQQDWDVLDVTTVDDEVVVRLAGPPPIPSTEALEAALEAAGISPRGRGGRVHPEDVGRPGRRRRRLIRRHRDRERRPR